MTDGLLTRIGKWLDRKWENKATESQLDAVEAKLVAAKLDVGQMIGKVNDEFNALLDDLLKKVGSDNQLLINSIERISAKCVEIDALVKTPQAYEKEISDLKSRIEKIELYSGMTRKVDPTKPAVAKSAFSM